MVFPLHTECIINICMDTAGLLMIRVKGIGYVCVCVCIYALILIYIFIQQYIGLPLPDFSWSEYYNFLQY